MSNCREKFRKLITQLYKLSFPHTFININLKKSINKYEHTTQLVSHALLSSSTSILLRNFLLLVILGHITND